MPRFEDGEEVMWALVVGCLALLASILLAILAWWINHGGTLR